MIDDVYKRLNSHAKSIYESKLPEVFDISTSFEGYFDTYENSTYRTQCAL